MKASSKAALLSAFVFPGLGHLYLKQFRRGLAILLIAIGGLGVLIWSAAAAAMRFLSGPGADMTGGTPDLQKIQDILGSNALTAGPCYDAAFYILVCLWLFAVIDAYRIGKRRESPDP